jgi:hypothetical protein
MAKARRTSLGEKLTIKSRDVHHIQASRDSGNLEDKRLSIS